MSEPAWHDESLREPDERFPSGRWTGYWRQGALRGRMQLDLTFGGGRVFGEGRDCIGDFVISGGYDLQSARCAIHKAYLGQHGVEYEGVAGADGIRGSWQILDSATHRVESSGPFHIWPLGGTDGAALETAAEVTAPA
jgi:hypothetical protein